MKRLSVLQAVLLSGVIGSCTLTLGCLGAANGGSVAVQPTIQGTANPLVAQYTLVSTCAGQATVQFGPTTAYGRITASYPVAEGQPTNILVAGMRASTLYHMQSQIECSSGSVSTSADQTFTTGSIPPGRSRWRPWRT